MDKINCKFYSIFMTIKARNNILRIFVIISAAVLASISFYFILAYTRGELTVPQNTERIYKFTKLQKTLLFEYNFNVTVAGIFVLASYVTITLFILTAGFIKNQSIELTYFAVFLLGCQVEAVRLLLPTFGIWQTTSSLLILAGRAVIGARVLCPLSMFLSALFAEAKDSTSIERNCLLALLVSVGIASSIPLDTNITTSTLTVLWGLRKTFLALRIFIMVITLIAMLINAYQRYSTLYRGIIVGYAIMITGYEFLISADCYFLFGVGCLGLILGTIFYLHYIHKIYLWR